MEHTISILFYTRKTRQAKGDTLPIYLRITINGKRIEQTINRTIELSKWSNKAGKVKGNTADAKSINNLLETIKGKVYSTERALLQEGKIITYEAFKERWFGTDIKQYLILEVFRQHNEKVAQLIGKDFSAATLERYKISLDHTKNLILWKYKVTDLDVTKLNYEFISEYAFWLKTVRK